MQVEWFVAMKSRRGLDDSVDRVHRYYDSSRSIAIYIKIVYKTPY